MGLDLQPHSLTLIYSEFDGRDFSLKEKAFRLTYTIRGKRPQSTFTDSGMDSFEGLQGYRIEKHCPFHDERH